MMSTDTGGAAVGTDSDAATSESVESDGPTADPPDVSVPDESRSIGRADHPDEAALPDRSDAGREGTPLTSLSTSALLLNVAVSQGVFGGLVLLGAWYTEIPLAAFGVSGVPDLRGVALGVGVGIALYAGNELAAASASALGFSPPEDLRAMLAPDSVAGWVLLLCLILPAIAFVEELLFRAALIGALSTGFAVSPWALAVVSSIAFALGHGAQGPVGMIVTGSLGLVLAAAFVLTGSLLVVVIAHYVVNALEFVVHEGVGVKGL